MANLTEARRARYRQELENAETSLSTKIPFLKLKSGVTRVRVLPGIDPASADKDFYCKASAHYFVSPHNPKLPVTCPKSKNPKAICPVCTKMDQLKNSSNKADNAEAEKLRARPRYYLGVIPREGEDAGKVMIYPAPKQIFTKILALMEDPDFSDVTSVEEGHDLKFSRTGEGKETRYDVTPTPKKTVLTHDPEELDQILKGQPELWRFREAASADEIEQFMEGDLLRFTTGGFASKAKGDIKQGDTLETKSRNPKAVDEDEDDVEVPAPVVKKAKATVIVDDDEDVPVLKKKSKFANIEQLKKDLEDDD